MDPEQLQINEGTMERRWKPWCMGKLLGNAKQLSHTPSLLQLLHIQQLDKAFISSVLFCWHVKSSRDLSSVLY